MLSLVIPAHNEAANLEPLLARLVPVLREIGLPYEIVFVDDGSRDDTLEALKRLRRDAPQIKIVALSRNFGKEVALAAGLRHARGAAVAMMDADLQHPPEVLKDFVAKWREGIELVYAQRGGREREPRFRRWLTGLFYRFFARTGEVSLLQGGGDFCLLDRKVVDALNAIPERGRFGKGLYAWVGFRRAAVPFAVADRHAGRSRWSLWRLFSLAIDAITSFSIVPLRIWTWLGFVIALIALAFGLFILVRTLIFGIDVPGYASLMVGISFLAGVQLIGLGVIGEYVGRIFTEVKGRPLYLVRERVGFDEPPQ